LFNAAAQTRKIDSPEVLKQLLTMPAPVPRSAMTPEAAPQVADPRPTEFYDRDKNPPDDAPIQDLVDYWMRWAESERAPSEAVSKRLLEACAADPAILPAFLDLLPDDDSTPAKVKSIYDKAEIDTKVEKDWRDRIRNWLVFNSTYYLEELLAMAHKAKDNQRDGDVDKEDALSALAEVSWTNAEPLLRGLMASGQPRATALALSLYYEHAVKEKDLGNEERYRRDLQAIAANRNQPGYARNVAIESLSLTEWSGLEDWYLGLFQDESLLDLSDGEYSMTPFVALFSSDLEKWIPIMTRLLESNDINVRSMAASCLVTVDDDEEMAKKALTPLLPWLTNPAWLNDRSSHRMRLIQALGAIKIPESVPGLISVVETDDADGYARGFAANSLALYEDPRAVPALKKALTKEKDEASRLRLIRGLLGSNALSEQEQLEALEAYATKIAAAETKMEVMHYRLPTEEPLSPTLSIGKYLGQSRETPSESFINAVLARAEDLKSQNSPIADALIEIAHQWQGHQIELDIIRRIGNGSADSATISEAIQRKDKMQQGLRTELQGLASVEGAAQGVGAALLSDPALAHGILNSQDEPAQIALLACSRLSQMALPVEMVAALLKHKNALVTQAAETYLLAEDSREARDLLWQRHPNEAFVTGWRENLMYGMNYEHIIKTEDQLRAELLKENGPIEILAWVSNSPNQGTIVRIYRDKAVYTQHEDAARYRERTVPMAEVAALKDFLSVGGFAERGPIFGYCHHGCPVVELMMLTKEKGRRVFHQGGYQEWLPIEEQFAQLGNGDGAKMHYKLEEEIKGLEVLYAGELLVNDVSQQGNELRVFVERPQTKEELEELQATYNGEDEDDEEQLTQLVRRRVQLNKTRYSWRVFANDKLGAPSSAPDFYSVVDEMKFITGDEHELDWYDNFATEAQILSPDSIIFAENYGNLYRQFAGAKPVRIGDENAVYMDPIVTRDGKWVIASKVNDEGDEPKHIVRVSLQTGREFRVNVPAADQLAPTAFVPVLNRVLVKRAKADYVMPGLKPKGPDRAEHFLIDPANGVTRLVSGEFAPLEQPGSRFLQATEKPDEFWAAISDDKKNQTQIGRYHLRDFSFNVVTTVPQLLFDSMSMWVDEGQKKVYVVYKGQLLRLPLQPPPAK
jgi:hypothetical protein